MKRKDILALLLLGSNNKPYVFCINELSYAVKCHHNGTNNVPPEVSLCQTNQQQISTNFTNHTTDISH